MSMQYWVEKKARGRSDIPQWKRDQEPSLLNFDLAHVVEEWKHIAIRSTGARFPPPQNSLREVALFHANHTHQTPPAAKMEKTGC